MFIRRTQTRSTTTGEAYFTHRLVRSERVGDKVRQRTLLNLGRHFDAAQSDWPALCRRIEEVLGGQLQLAPDCPPALESHAQHIAAQFDALLMLFELLMAVFMEKHTPKSSANSSLPASQSPNDETARTRPGAKGKGPSLNDARCANTRTRESVRVLADSGPSRSPNPAQADHPFRFKPITDSGRTRSPIPVPSRSLFGGDRNRSGRPV